MYYNSPNNVASINVTRLIEASKDREEPPAANSALHPIYSGHAVYPGMTANHGIWGPNGTPATSGMWQSGGLWSSPGVWQASAPVEFETPCGSGITNSASLENKVFSETDIAQDQRSSEVNATGVAELNLNHEDSSATSNDCVVNSSTKSEASVAIPAVENNNISEENGTIESEKIESTNDSFSSDEPISGSDGSERKLQIFGCESEVEQQNGIDDNSCMALQKINEELVHSEKLSDANQTKLKILPVKQEVLEVVSVGDSGNKNASDAALGDGVEGEITPLALVETVECTKSTRAQRARRVIPSVFDLFESRSKKGKKGKGTKKTKNSKQRSLTIGQKMEVIEMIEQKISPKLIRAIYELKSSTFYDIKKNADKIKEYAKENQCMMSNRWDRRSMKGMGFPEIEKAVYNWFLQQKNAGVAVRGVDIQDTAQRFAKHFNQEHFKASAGWLFQFRKRHCLITRKNKSAKRAAREAAEKAAKEAAAAAEEASTSSGASPAKGKKKSASARSKNPRSKARTISQKLKVVEMIEGKVSPKLIMGMFKLKRSTFYDIRRDATKIKEFARNNQNTDEGSGNGWERRSMKRMGYPEVDKAVYSWYLEQKAAGASVRGVDIQHAAERFAKEFKEDNFKASSGWLFRFRKRHCLTKLSIIRSKGTRKAKKKEKPNKKPVALAPSGQAQQHQTHHPNSVQLQQQHPQHLHQAIPHHQQHHHHIQQTHHPHLHHLHQHHQQHPLSLTTAQQPIHLNHPQVPLNLNGQPSLSLGSQQPLPLSSEQQFAFNSQHPISLNPPQPLPLTSQQHLHLTAHQPLPLTTQPHMTVNSQSFPLNQPLTLSSHHSLPLTSHQSLPQQPLPLTSHQQPIPISSHQSFNLNVLNNSYANLNAINNPYHITKGT